VSLGGDTPRIVPAIIEIPKGEKVKYELDKPSGLLRVDRVLHSAVYYPANYGFIPQSYAKDHDPLDILVLGQEMVAPLAIVNAKPIGAMRLLDQGEEDDKIIAVHADDPEYAHYESIRELPPHRLTELRRFFEDYKALEHKAVIVDRFVDRKSAHRMIREALAYYSESRDLLRAGRQPSSG
jgi:inorganic pyrophosphatase